uniref:Transposase n=1 Tax=Streptomyces sp. NBC_00093 TaxID=2975649 RepID=A0AAU2AH98_9ACTN
MSEIPEEQRAAALRTVKDAGDRRNDLLKKAEKILTEEIRPAALHAARLDAGRSRIRELAGIGPSVLYRWLKEAGLPVRDKKKSAPTRKGKR